MNAAFDRSPEGPSKPLSERQRLCLRLASAGLTSSAIAAEVGVSPRTVDEHIALACRTLGVRTRIQAAAWLVRSEHPATEPKTVRP